MLIQQHQQGNKGFFFVGDKESPLAEMTYSLTSPDKMIIEHTEVSDELRGKNIGYQLVHHAVEYARTNNLKIIPLCPFANAVIKKNPGFHDILYTL